MCENVRLSDIARGNRHNAFSLVAISNLAFTVASGRIGLDSDRSLKGSEYNDSTGGKAAHHLTGR